jgi:hypothetical protein
MSDTFKLHRAKAAAVCARAWARGVCGERVAFSAALAR